MSTPVAKLSARELLLAAATESARQPVGEGTYWRIVSSHELIFNAGDYNVVRRHESEDWVPGVPDKDRVGVMRDLGARPFQAADEAAWKAAGSPNEIKVTVGDSKAKTAALTIRPTPERVQYMAPHNGGAVFWLGENVTVEDLRNLPDDPAELKRWLLKSYKGTATEGDRKQDSDGWLFAVSLGLVTSMPITPKVGGAAFEMLAELDSITSLGEVTDARGRTGVGVAIKDPRREGGVVQSRLIIDPATGQALASENTVLEPGGNFSHLEKGVRATSSVVVKAEWTDETPPAATEPRRVP
ncbi:CU044_5270 family protein [Sinosporangium siamense]|uniref:CU044_5270 family protein n=1 Tax=Sinosporangium siamense TaxID=1367973 RepID=UPI0023B24D41|nr:CU044_5270 family protein [Sinosporangium siamense]